MFYILDENNKPKTLPEGIAESEAVMVAYCLYIGDVPVHLDTVKKWPRRIVKALADKCDALNKEVKDESKNSQSAGTVTSV